MREYPVGPVAVHEARRSAVREAAKIDGRVFFRDADGYLELVFGTRLGDPLVARGG